MIRLAILSPSLLCMAAGAAVAAAPPPTPADVAVFKEMGAYVLRDSGESLPLYTFDRDQPGKSNCNGPCAAAWPPLAATPESGGVGDWSVIKRGDGGFQWAWRGKPIYTFAKDSPEKASGDGAGGVWRLLPPIPAD